MSSQSGDGASPSRRKWLYASVGLAAAAAGAGLGWRQWQAEGSSGELSDFWAMSFPTPAGTPVAMQSLRGRPLLLNFWATWCPPCVEELPLLDGFYTQNSAKSWQVLGLAVDQVAAVHSFLGRTPVSFPIVMAGLGGTGLSKALGNQSGGLPFTVLVSAGGRVLERRMGRVTAEDLTRWSASS